MCPFRGRAPVVRTERRQPGVPRRDRWQQCQRTAPAPSRDKLVTNRLCEPGGQRGTRRDELLARLLCKPRLQSGQRFTRLRLPVPRQRANRLSRLHVRIGQLPTRSMLKLDQLRAHGDLSAPAGSQVADAHGNLSGKAETVCRGSAVCSDCFSTQPGGLRNDFFRRRRTLAETGFYWKRVETAPQSDDGSGPRQSRECLVDRGAIAQMQKALCG